MQAVSACFALDHLEGEDHTIERPAAYAQWRAERPPGWPEGRLSPSCGARASSCRPEVRAY
jgi:hypothetical protein